MRLCDSMALLTFAFAAALTLPSALVFEICRDGIGCFTVGDFFESFQA